MEFLGIGEMDVYETEDSAALQPFNKDDDDSIVVGKRSEEETREELFESSDIERVHFDVSEAMRRFGKCYLDTERTGTCICCFFNEKTDFEVNLFYTRI